MSFQTVPDRFRPFQFKKSGVQTGVQKVAVKSAKYGLIIDFTSNMFTNPVLKDIKSGYVVPSDFY